MLIKDKDGNITGYDLTQDVNFKKFIADVDGISKAVKGVLAIAQANQTQMGQFKTQFEELRKTGGKPPSDNSNDDDDDLGELPANKFRDKLLGEVGALLDEKLKGVTERVGQLGQSILKGEFKAEAKELAGLHKDFNDWDDEMTALAKQHPSLNLKQLHRMARDENPNKAKELDEKYKPAPEKKDDGLSLFGGLRPTIGTSGDGEGKKLTAEEAAEKAWQETVAEFPALERYAGDANTTLG